MGSEKLKGSTETGMNYIMLRLGTCVNTVEDNKHEDSINNRSSKCS